MANLHHEDNDLNEDVFNSASLDNHRSVGLQKAMCIKEELTDKRGFPSFADAHKYYSWTKNNVQKSSSASLTKEFRSENTQATENDYCTKIALKSSSFFSIPSYIYLGDIKSRVVPESGREHIHCKGSFSSNHKHRMHTQACRSKCVCCGKYVKRFHKLIHSGKTPCRCFVCDLQFTQSNGLKQYNCRSRTGKKSFQCDTCGKCFRFACQFKNHIRIHTEKPYQCFRCDKYFITNANLIQHQRIHTDEKPYQCSICDKQFSRSGGLVRHQRVHTGEKPFQCTTCKRYFSERHSLKEHTMCIHNGEKPYRCSICDKQFSRSRDLVKHQRVHTGEKPFQCTTCERYFSERGSLKRHIICIHSGEKPYQCSICDKYFNRNADLIQHQRTHTDEKPYQCSVCGKSFNRNSNLIQHQRTHTGEKPYQCFKCDKRFSRNGSLLRHQRIHTGQNFFQCATCERCFPEHDSLREHIMHIHTGEKKY